MQSILYSQDVGDDPQGPHVRAVPDRLEVDHLRRHELRRAEQDLGTGDM